MNVPNPTPPPQVRQIKQFSAEDLSNRFFFHPPRDKEAIKNHERVSELAHAFAEELTRICPHGRNLALALTALEDVRMRANAAIACDDPRLL